MAVALAAALVIATVIAACGADGASGGADLTGGASGGADLTGGAPGDIATADTGHPSPPDAFIHLGGDTGRRDAGAARSDTTPDAASGGETTTPHPCRGRGDCPPGLRCCDDGGCRVTCGGGSTGCRSDADCDEGERCCADGGCRVDCAGLAPTCGIDDDCPQGESCCEDAECRAVCEGDPPDPSCTTDGDCPEGQRCIRVGSTELCLTTCGIDADCPQGRSCQPFGGLIGQHIEGLPNVCTCASDTACDDMPCCDFPFGALKTCMVVCPDAGLLGGL